MRSFSAVGLAALAGLLFACGSEAAPPADSTSSVGAEITEVNYTPVKNQPVGNCWIYASLGWVESLEQRAVGGTPDYSEAYFTMYDWILKMVSEFPLEDGKVPTGGAWELFLQEIEIFGVMTEADFTHANSVADAEIAFNEALATGALADPAARLDQALVMEEAFKAFGVDEPLRDKIRANIGSKFPRDIKVKWPNARTLEAEEHTLADALREWTVADYPRTSSDRRAFQVRVQRSLHGGAPVLISWQVDFNAMSGSTFSLDTLGDQGPGDQGGHQSLLYDYQVNDVPGFGTLQAGVLETRAEALEAALSPEATIEFFRIKNSWGDTERADDAKPTDAPNGYYDLEMKYLDGPIKQADGTDIVPLSYVLLPPGF